MIFEQIPVGPMQNFSYLVGDEKTGLAAVIDPAWDISAILEMAKKRNVRIAFAIDTHNHPDHTSGNRAISDATGAKIVAHESSRIRKDFPVKDGDTLRVGSLELKFIHTPGHSPDHISILIEDKLMTGDTLFVGECGRIDLPGGSAEQLYHSLFDRLLSLPDNVEVYPGHDYGAKPRSTIGEERAHNYVLRPRTLKEFVEFMKEP